VRIIVLRDAIDALIERQHAAHFIIGKAARLSRPRRAGMIAA
jgi:hypothetical protein